MNKTDDGVTPFFVHTEPPKGPQLVFNQVELRDYFAAAALQGLLDNGGGKSWEDDAENAYRAADAMIRAREVKP